MRTPASIRREIAELSERRAALWAGGDSPGERQAEIASLSEEIDRLWAELRLVRAELLCGSREQILESARRAQQVERELRRYALSASLPS
jgi:hypothetical protein